MENQYKRAGTWEKEGEDIVQKKKKKFSRSQALLVLLLTKQLGGDIGLFCRDCCCAMKQYPLFVFAVTVLVLTIIACSYCCSSCCGCDGRPDPRRRKSQVRPAARSWGDRTCCRGHARTPGFSAMGMTFHTSPLKMAIAILMNMTQRTRNHSVEFLLSVTATTVTRKVKLLCHHCLPLLGQDGVGGHGHRLLRKETAFPKTCLQLGQLRIPSGTRSHGAKQRPHTALHTRHCLLSSPLADPEGLYWVLAKPTDTTGRSSCSGHRGSRPNLLQKARLAEISAENNKWWTFWSRCASWGSEYSW